MEEDIDEVDTIAVCISTGTEGGEIIYND